MDDQRIWLKYLKKVVITVYEKMCSQQNSLDYSKEGIEYVNKL